MNLTSPNGVRDYLRLIGVQPNSRLGQNFLIDRNILMRILDTAELESTDVVLEVGPGLGVMTEPMLKRVKKLLVVEKDKGLASALRTRFSSSIPDKLSVTHADMLNCNLAELLRSEGLNADSPVKVVSNLPYSVGSRILVDLIQSSSLPDLMVVTVQLEVAQRLSASPGTKTYGLLGLWMQDLYEVDLVKTVSPTCFWPRPTVKSAVVRMRRRNVASPRQEETERFRTITRHAFEHRRKQLPSLLERGPANLRSDDVRAWLQQHGYSPTARPEAVSVEHWRQLARDLVSRA